MRRSEFVIFTVGFHIYDFQGKGSNSILVWAVIQGIGAVLSYCVSKHIAIAAFAIWLLVFIKDVHLDEDKAFGKYKKV